MQVAKGLANRARIITACGIAHAEPSRHIDELHPKGVASGPSGLLGSDGLIMADADALEKAPRVTCGIDQLAEPLSPNRQIGARVIGTQEVTHLSCGPVELHLSGNPGFRGEFGGRRGCVPPSLGGSKRGTGGFETGSGFGALVLEAGALDLGCLHSTFGRSEPGIRCGGGHLHHHLLTDRARFSGCEVGAQRSRHVAMSGRMQRGLGGGQVGL